MPSDQDILHRLAVDTARDHPRAVMASYGDAQALGWEEILVPILIEVALAFLRECRNRTPEALVREARRIKDAPWYDVVARRRYNRVWWAVEGKLAASPQDYTRDDVTEATEALLRTASLTGPDQMAACMRVARA